MEQAHQPVAYIQQELGMLETLSSKILPETPSPQPGLTTTLVLNVKEKLTS